MLPPNLARALAKGTVMSFFFVLFCGGFADLSLSQHISVKTKTKQQQRKIFIMI